MKSTKQYGKRIDLALSLWVKLARAFRTFSKLAEDDIRTYGLTEPQFSALETLGHKGPLTLGQLCKKRLSTGGNMTVVVDNLEELELVERVPSKEDRRSIIVQPTAKGKKRFKEIFQRHARVIARAASVLTAQEQEELGGLLKKLGTKLQENA